jgi:RNA polymerase sigma-70 factor (ECF subfamily)
MSTATEGLLPAVVASAASGDEVAFARIVNEHHDDMTRVAYVVSGDVDIAQDAVQAAWAVAWRKLHTLRDPALLRPWLVSVAANEARQLIRRRHRRGVVEIAVQEWMADAPITDPGVPARERNLDLLNAIGQLAPSDRTIVAMRYAMGLTSEEIGQAIGMSGVGVRSRLARALVRLKKDLGDV